MRILSPIGPRFIVATLLCLLAVGCARRPAWHGEMNSATLAYWIEQPATSRVVAEDYGELWEAAENTRVRFGFPRATADYRGGLLSTGPTVSPQFFEVWRRELRTLPDMTEASLATVRRRIRFEFGETDDGEFYVEPKVLVERLSLAERRISSAIDFRRILGPGRQIGTRFTDRGQRVPLQYWYAIGRDDVLERTLALRIAREAGGIVRQPLPQDPEASAALQ